MSTRKHLGREIAAKARSMQPNAGVHVYTAAKHGNHAGAANRKTVKTDKRRDYGSHGHGE